MKLTPRQGTALAVVLAAMRPDWPEESLLTFLRTHADTLPFSSTQSFILAAVMTANDPKALTPAAILKARATAVAAGTTPPAEPQPGKRCVDHPAFAAAVCRLCESEIKAGDRPRPMKGLHWDIPPLGGPIPQTPYIPTPSGPTWMDRSTGRDE